MNAGTIRSQKSVPDPLEIEIQAVVTCKHGGWEYLLRSFRRTGHVFNH